jgi:hypothetical protein
MSNTLLPAWSAYRPVKSPDSVQGTMTTCAFLSARNMRKRYRLIEGISEPDIRPHLYFHRYPTVCEWK